MTYYQAFTDRMPNITYSLNYLHISFKFHTIYIQCLNPAFFPPITFKRGCKDFSANSVLRIGLSA